MRAAASEELMKPIFHSNLEITDVTVIAIYCIIKCLHVEQQLLRTHPSATHDGLQH